MSLLFLSGREGGQADILRTVWWERWIKKMTEVCWHSWEDKSDIKKMDRRKRATKERERGDKTARQEVNGGKI